jgi:hypothetical protein
MLAFQRMKRLFPWKPHVKKGQRQSESYHVTQYNGTPGWLLLTHDEIGSAVALFVDLQDRVTILPIILDERLFSDSVFRVVRLSRDMFIVYDVRVLNGTNIFETQHFEDRQQLVTTLLEDFHKQDLTALITVDDVPPAIPVRGEEWYDFRPGTVGVFLPADE